MGRSANSFTTWVGRAEETIDSRRINLPEKELWIAVLTRAVLDAVKGPPDLDMTRRANKSHKSLYNFNRQAARHFFMEGGTHFRLICELAGRNPDYVQTKIRKVILRKNGWNVDVPITSHYRQGSKKGPYKKRGRPRKKYRKTFTGANGVRPKLYVV